jgi:hypothetical protein
MVVLGSRREGLYFTGHRVEVKFQRVMCGTEGGLKAYFWWIESVLATVMDHTCSNIISRDCRFFSLFIGKMRPVYNDAHYQQTHRPKHWCCLVALAHHRTPEKGCFPFQAADNFG